VQNQVNADYGLLTFMYLQHEPARKTLLDVDVGDASAEARVNAQFTEWTNYTQTGNFLRDHFYGSPAVVDRVRHVRDYYRFRANIGPNTYRGYAVGLRLDRMGTPNSTGICQAEVYVDGQYAGLMHCFTHSNTFAWKEGGELEVELPRALTDGKNAFTIEVRPRASSDPLRLARVTVYGYTAD
jgi:hypothetical protein